jgi:hypothetical protein
MCGTISHVEAFPDDAAPTYLLRDRDRIYGAEFARRVEQMGIREVLIAPRALAEGSGFILHLVSHMRHTLGIAATVAESFAPLG